LLYPLLLLV